MTRPTHFQDQLLVQLRAVVLENPVPAHAEGARRRAPALRTRLALSGVGLALAVVAAVIMLAGSSAAPQSAYAVNTHSNGTVTVHVRSLSDAAGLQDSLRAAGVPALVNYAPATSLPACPIPKGSVSTRSMFSEKAAPGSGPKLSTGGRERGSAGEGPALSSGGAPEGAGDLPTPPPAGSHITGSVEVSKDGVSFSVDPGSIKPDEQLVITTSEGTLSTIGMAIVKRSVGACSATPPIAP